jgi:hypothetical protein
MFSLGLWEKTSHCKFNFGVAISTLDRQEEDSSGVLIGIHYVSWFHVRERWDEYKLA